MNSQYQELAGLLSQLMNSNNAIRSNAESQFESFYQQQSMMMINLLLEIFANQQESVILRTFSTILIRRGIDKYYSNLSQDFVIFFRDRVIEAWKAETNLSLSSKLTHVIGQLSFQSDWKTLLPSVLQFAGSQQDNLINAFKTLSLLEVYVDYCPEDISSNYQMIGGFLSAFFNVEDFRLRLLSAKATAAVVAALDSDEARNAFKPALQSIQAVIELALQKGDESDVTKLIEYLVAIAQSQPLFFKASFDSMTRLMLNICNQENFEFSTRTMALELIITISESAPALARRSTGFIETAIAVMMKFMLEVEDDEETWRNGKYNDDSLDEDAIVGEEALERISNGLGGKSVTELVLKAVQSFSAQTHWPHRRAAVAAVCRLAEGATKYFRNYLDQVSQFLLSSLQDPSVRVQYEAIQTIGRYASLYNEDLATLVDRFLPALASMMQNHQNCAKIRGHAASALINLLHPEDVDAEASEKYLEPLLQSLVMTFQSAPYEVRSPCLSILGCVAQACPESFAPYYDQFMPGIKNILVEATSPELIELRGKAMECAGLIGDAVGVERFSRDAIEIMRVFFSLMNVDADVTFDYILPACARIAKAIKVDFVQYLPMIFPMLLAGANQEIQFSFEDASEEEVEGEVTHDDETGTESTVITLGGGVRKRITLNTHSVQQKTQATKVIFELVDALGALLGEYLLPSIDSLFALVVDKHSTNIRYSAALGLAKAFQALLEILPQLQQGNRVNVGEIFHKAVLYLMEAMKNEPDNQARQAQVEAIRDLLDAVYLTGREEVDGNRPTGHLLSFPETLLQQFLSFLLMQCAECMVRRSQTSEKILANEALDPEDQQQQVEEAMEEEDEILTVLIDILGYLLKLQQEPSSNSNRFMPIFDQTIAPAFSSYLAPDQPLALQRMIVCLLDDVIEFGGSAGAAKYIPDLLPILLMNSQTEDLLLKQCSMYGLAMMCYKAPEVLLSTKIPNNGESLYLAALVSCFVTIILHPEASEEDNQGITENAIFGLVCLLANPLYRPELQKHSQTFPLVDLFGLVMKRLPLKLDAVEIKITTLALCSLIESKESILFQHFLPDILRIFGELLMKNQEGKGSGFETSPASVAALPSSESSDETFLLPEYTKQKMRSILTQLQQAQMIHKSQLQELSLEAQKLLLPYSC